MTPAVLDIAFEIAAILLTLIIILRTIPMLKTGKNPMAAALFLFAIVSQMLSFAYWLAYSLIRPEVRMPFAANEIGEIAWFLLLASVPEMIFRERKLSAKKETVFALIYAVASVALWIAWSGEWIQDIICGLAFGYFLLICVRSLKQTDALNKAEWCMLGISCAIIILVQTSIFFVPEGAKLPLDYFCYALMFATLLWFITKSFFALKRMDGTEIAITFGACAFGFSTLYMSSGWFYLAAFAICLLTLPLMLIALRREVAD